MSQREVHTHATSFASAVQAAVREDPDVVLVGEMRDLETIRTALNAAESGFTVFGTLHTNNAAKHQTKIFGSLKDILTLLGKTECYIHHPIEGCPKLLTLVQ